DVQRPENQASSRSQKLDLEQISPTFQICCFKNQELLGSSHGDVQGSENQASSRPQKLDLEQMSTTSQICYFKNQEVAGK
ncbi:MAG: hypothetical protein ACJAVI_002341, partial [Candidatus Azotimanducaceae bacterium]